MCDYDVITPGNYTVTGVREVDFEKLRADSEARQQARSAQKLWLQMRTLQTCAKRSAPKDRKRARKRKLAVTKAASTVVGGRLDTDSESSEDSSRFAVAPLARNGAIAWSVAPRRHGWTQLA